MTKYDDSVHTLTHNELNTNTVDETEAETHQGNLHTLMWLMGSQR